MIDVNIDKNSFVYASDLSPEIQMIITKKENKNIRVCLIDLSDGEELTVKNVKNRRNFVSFCSISEKTDHKTKIKLDLTNEKVIDSSICFKTKWYKNAVNKKLIIPDNLICPETLVDFTGKWNCIDLNSPITIEFSRNKRNGKLKLKAYDLNCKKFHAIENLITSNNRVRFEMKTGFSGKPAKFVMNLNRNGTATVSSVIPFYWFRKKQIISVDINKSEYKNTFENVWESISTRRHLVIIDKNDKMDYKIRQIVSADRHIISILSQEIHEKYALFECKSEHNNEFRSCYYLEIQKNGTVLAKKSTKYRLLSIDKNTESAIFSGCWKFDCPGTEILFKISLNQRGKYEIIIQKEDANCNIKVSSIRFDQHKLFFICTDLETDTKTEHVLTVDEYGKVVDEISSFEIWVNYNKDNVSEFYSDIHYFPTMKYLKNSGFKKQLQSSR